MELLREADRDGEIGIDRMSPQTFLATLNASCCSYPVQLVGIDYGTDFLIKPWLERTLHRDLKDGEVILGHHVAGDEGDELTFFKKGFPVEIAIPSSSVLLKRRGKVTQQPHGSAHIHPRLAKSAHSTSLDDEQIAASTIGDQELRERAVG